MLPSNGIERRRSDLRVDIVVLVHGSRSSGGSLDWRGSDERHQPSEGDGEGIHGSVLADSVVIVVWAIGSVVGLIERSSGEKVMERGREGRRAYIEQGERRPGVVCYARQKLLRGGTHLGFSGSDLGRVSVR